MYYHAILIVQYIYYFIAAFAQEMVPFVLPASFPPDFDASLIGVDANGFTMVVASIPEGIDDVAETSTSPSTFGTRILSPLNEEEVLISVNQIPY